MIYLKRGPAPASLNLSEVTGSTASKELDDARDYFLANNTGPPGDHFSAYARPDVREAIHTQFFGKCCYCEKRVDRRRELNIEHFRPKSGIDEYENHPGYWWLAMRWENLLPSCQNCNSKTRQPVIEPDMTVEDIKNALLEKRWSSRGKQNFFPTEDNSWISTEGEALNDEKPLLIDPTERDPEPMFEWKFLGSYILAMPKDGNRRARVTIDILGLNRADLCVDRMLAIGGIPEKQAWLEASIDAGKLDEAIDDQTVEELIWFISALEYRIHERQPHAAVARFFLRHLEERLIAAVA